MAENETPAPPTEPAAAGTAAVEGSTSQPAPTFTLEDIKKALLPEITNAMNTARRAQSAADRAPERFRQSIAPLEEAIEVLLTRDMTEDAREAFKAKKELARATRTNPEADQQSEVSAFQAEAASVLEEEGLRADDPVLAAAYQKFVATAKTPAQWRTALGRAVAAVHKDRAAKAEMSVSEREKKAREDERTKMLNESREKEGPIDRGQPASGTTKIDWLNLTPEEFARLDAAKTAERRARAAGAGRR